MPDDGALTRLRERLAERVITSHKIADPRIAAALRDVPRHLFLPHLPPHEAYRDDAIVTKRDADGQPISSSSQPAIMAIMLAQLGLTPGQRVLEIGAGTGYNAALMKHIVGPSGHVVSVDIESDLVVAARDHLASAGYPDVTVVAADGAAGYPPDAPYDRVIATVGVSDLAPAWLSQLAPDGRIVVPLDLRGTQVAAAFERQGPDGSWRSVSLAPCGFMRLRGSLAGPERTMVIQPGLTVMLPDGFTLADGTEADAGALAAFLAGPSVRVATGIRTEAVQVVWGLSLWLATGDARSCAVMQVRATGSAGRRRPAGPDAAGPDAAGPAGAGSAGAIRLARAPVRGRGVRATSGILDSGGIALLTANSRAAVRAGTGEPLRLTLEVTGYGPHAAGLAAELAAHLTAWDEAGQPGVAGLHVDAYPRATASLPAPAPGMLLIERTGTRFAVYHLQG
jgi:protein-L-isoaspartate(D-aspartate) O-methyltransferase